MRSRRQSTRRRSKRKSPRGRDAVDNENPEVPEIKIVDTPITAALRRLTGCAVIVCLEYPLRQFYINYANRNKDKYK